MRLLATLTAAAIVLAAACPAAWAEGEGDSPPPTTNLFSVLGVAALCGGAALVLLAGALGISRIGTHAVDAIARQPEAAGGMFMAWLLPAMMIEVATMFGMVICYMAMSLLRP
ncbi:MAG TPA: ATP synthase F0 subunit C [Phycisphaerae bacterium]|nr:ATP synthase F0 subunit C [Phycisphaerae bacterium]